MACWGAGRPVECCRVFILLRRGRPAAVPGRSVLAQAAAQQLAAGPGRQRLGRSRRPCLAAAAAALAERRRERRDAEAAAQQMLRARPVGHGVRRRRQLHPGLGLSRHHAVGDQRARHPRRQAGFVWIAGNDANDSAIFKYTKDGKPVLTIGKLGPTGGSNDTTLLGRPADIQVDTDAKEVFVADGYGNRRVIVFDSETGAYKRHWGAYGNQPKTTSRPAYDPAADAVAAVRQPGALRQALERRPGLCLRPQQQPHPGVQEGRHVRHRVVLRQATLGAGAVWDLNFCPTPTRPSLRRRRREQPSRILRAATARWSAVRAVGPPGR